MNKRILIITGAAVLIGGLLASDCHRWKHHRGVSKEKIEWFKEHLAQELNLNAEQKTKLAEIAKRFTDKVPEWREKRAKMTDILAKSFESDKFDPQPVNAEIDSMQKQFPEMKTMAVQALSDFHAILTPQQRKKFAELVKKHQENYKQ